MGYELRESDVYGLAQQVGATVRRRGEELFFQLCPYCHGGESRDKDTFSVNLTSGAFSCFRSGCGKKGHFVELCRDFGYPLDFGEKQGRQYRKFPQKPVEVREPAVEYLKSRGIGEEVARKYRVTCRRDDPSILAFPFYDEHGVMQFIKYRNTRHQPGQGNKEWCEKDGKPILFGMDRCTGSGRLILTEGQIDSLSLAQAGLENAVSVPNGKNGFTWLGPCWGFLEAYSEVVVFGDNEGGEITLAAEMQKKSPIRVKAVRPEDYLGEKDANDILRKYGPQALLTAVGNAREAPLPKVKELCDVKAVDLNSLPRIRTSLPEVDKLIGGIFPGQVALLTGKRGEGKSTFMSQLVAESLEQGWPVFVYSGELTDYHFKRWLDFQVAGPDWVRTSFDAYGEPRYSLDASTVEKINSWYRGRAYLYDNNALEGDELEGLLDTVEKAVKRYGIKAVFLDNLMTAMSDDPKSDLYRQQSRFVHQLKLLAVRQDVAVVLVAHLRKDSSQKKGVPVDDNDTIMGSGDITNRVDTVLLYARPEEGADCDGLLRVTKNRLFGRLTRKGEEVKLFYSASTKRISSKGSSLRHYGWEANPEEEPLLPDLPF
nr:MAG TPA: DNA directed DNA polymerase [Caudoviricetes sp.]